MAQGKGTNSVENKIKSIEEVNNEPIMPPEGIEFRSEEEEVVWHQFVGARARNDWRDMDLILLYKIVEVEVDIRKYKKRLDDEGAIVENKRGTLVENALFRVLDTLIRQQMTIIRSMSLNSNGDARQHRTNAKAQEDAKRAVKKNGPLSLLAQP